MPAAGLNALKVLLTLANVGQKIVKKAIKALEEPFTASNEDRKLIVAYCKSLDERRALFAPYHAEVAGSVMSSLDAVREQTRVVHAQLEHPVATAYLEAILDHLRKFLDKWDARLRESGSYRREPRDQELVEFCVDLGSLRESIRTFVALMPDIDKKAKAPNLFADESR